MNKRVDRNGVGTMDPDSNMISEAMEDVRSWDAVVKDEEKKAIRKAILEWKQENPGEEHRQNPEAGDWILDRAEVISAERLRELSEERQRREQEGARRQKAQRRQVVEDELDEEEAEVRPDARKNKLDKPEPLYLSDTLSRLTSVATELAKIGEHVVHVEGPNPDNGSITITFMQDGE